MKGSVWAFFLLSALVAISGGSGKEVLKICGRDFIRAVVYVCGGSRWKKDLQEAFEDKVEGTKFFDVPNQNGASEDLTDDSLLYPESPDDKIPSRNHHPVGTGRQKKEDLSSSLSIFCCEVGCTTKDLSKLC
ncbi:insulin-like peptide INSL5 [Monodelphis domestica]|uniref:Insulin like 5 n=1 Tax=Monodelphis domestica TaxID=13616 RepID=A0A5F8H6Q0_MONDO|nr:insulin-like peptide INSL5 [Monodelphis domestica]